MNGADWVRLYTDFFDNPKIRQISKRPQKDGDTIITIWINLICLAGKQNRCGVFMLTDTIPYTDEMLANEIGRSYEEEFKPAMAVLRRYEMIIDIDGVPAIKNWGVYQQQLDTLDKQREQTRMRVQRYREKQKEISDKKENVTRYKGVTVTLPVTQCNANVTQTEKELEIDKEIDIYNTKIKVDDEIKETPRTREEQSSSSTDLNELEEKITTFCKKFNIALDNYNANITEMDFDKLTERFDESEWLKTNISSFKRVCEYYPKIISGYYKDYTRKKRDNSYDILDKMLKQAKAEEAQEISGNE